MGTEKGVIGCLAVIIIFVIIILVGVWILSSGGKRPLENPSDIQLKASVGFNGTQFIIQNKDSFDWKNVKLEVNPEFLKGVFVIKGGYSYRAEIIMKAGEKYTVGVLQFVKEDGTRFNPLITKPMTFRISCNTPNGKGTWYSEWK